jgi:hypothetical protein
MWWRDRGQEATLAPQSRRQMLGRVRAEATQSHSHRPARPSQQAELVRRFGTLGMSFDQLAARDRPARRTR